MFPFFRSVFYHFRCVSVPADFSVSVFVFANGLIIFPLTDVSVSVNRNHTAAALSDRRICDCQSRLDYNYESI